MIDYTLGVASPLTRGKRVKDAQRVLKGGNVFRRDFLLARVDSVFGQETGRACIRAKFWLGYPTRELTATYGPDLDAFLRGAKRPTPAMVKLTAARQKKAKEKPLREKALTEALRHIGVKESPPGSNRVLFSRWYGLTGPWCAMFTTYCYAAGAKSKALVKGSRYAYVPYVVADARAGRNNLSVTRDPRPGDLVCFDWDGGVADHIGLFKGWEVKGRTFTAIEGNTAVGNDSNGGEVMKRIDRRSEQVEAFVRVGR